MPEHVVVSPYDRQLRHHGERGRELPCFPPNGMSTVAAPIVESKRSDEALVASTTFRSAHKRFHALGERVARPSALIGAACLRYERPDCFGRTVRCQKLAAHVDDGLAVPEACARAARRRPRRSTVASRFSSLAYPRNSSTSAAATAQAMRSWLSEMASSVPSRPSYFFGTLFKVDTQAVSESSPKATDTPPAPKSLQRLMSRQASPRRNSR